MGSLRVGHNWTTSLSLFTFMHWRRKWQPTPVFLLGESQGRGAWWLLSMGSHRVRHDWSVLAAAAAASPWEKATNLLQVVLAVKNPSANAGGVRAVGSIPWLRRFPGLGNGNPHQYSCLENPVDKGAWRAMVHRITKGWTLLKWLSMHACNILKYKQTKKKKKKTLEVRLQQEKPTPNQLTKEPQRKSKEWREKKTLNVCN